MTLTERIKELTEQHGGLRKAARAVKINVTYMMKLRNGTNTEPSAATLRKLGLRRVYVRSSTTRGSK